MNMKTILLFLLKWSWYASLLACWAVGAIIWAAMTNGKGSLPAPSTPPRTSTQRTSSGRVFHVYRNGVKTGGNYICETQRQAQGRLDAWLSGTNYNKSEFSVR